jgi:predicted protein tyrosine phosphatase
MAKLAINDSNVENQNACFISILGTVSFDWSNTELISYFKEDHPNTITLYFDDTLQDYELNGNKYLAMNELQAKFLFEFIKNNATKQNCFIHCLAGISRSGAVGEFICDYTQSSYEEFKQRNPGIHPNSHVKNLLNKLWRDDACISI